VTTNNEPRSSRNRSDAEERLVAAAADLLGEIGPRSLSVRTIADRAGVNHGLVHHYFGGKDGLLKAAMVRLVEEHAVHAKALSDGSPIPAPLALGSDPRYLRAVVRAVLDGEMALANTELTEGVSVPRGALEHVVAMRRMNEADVNTKATVAIGMALEMGWAALEPFLFSITGVTPDEEEEVRSIGRAFRTEFVARGTEI
jgi:TetR/AcrR family transcriptional regulator, repressor for neighboring sulfatase